MVGALALVVAAGIVLIVLATQPVTGTTYRVTYSNLLRPVRPDAIRVLIAVRNTGSTTGTPTCTVRATAPGHAGSGSGTFTENRAIRPRDSLLYLNTLTISHGAAGLVKRSDVSVACH